MTRELQPSQAAEFDVDAVITWVDGDDPLHRAKREAYLGDESHAGIPGAEPTRFRQSGELEFCVASLLRFAPWLRTIYIVTDAQIPPLTAQLRGTRFENRIQLVGHREIFEGLEQHLPTFNSLSIETVLWRIRGMADRFIYLNDDFQLLGCVAKEDFFRGEAVVLRGHWRETESRRRGKFWGGLLNKVPGRVGRPVAASNHDAQQLAADMLGFDEKFLQVPHCPHPMRVSTLETFFRRSPADLEANVTPRVRAAKQFVIVALANHLQVSRNAAIIDNRLRTVRLKHKSRWLFMLRRRIHLVDRDPLTVFCCVQSLDLASDSARSLIFQWLQRRIGTLDDVIQRSRSSASCRFQPDGNDDTPT